MPHQRDISKAAVPLGAFLAKEGFRDKWGSPNAFVCKCVGMCVQVHVRMGACVCGGQRLTSFVIPQEHLQHRFRGQDLFHCLELTK